MERPDFSCVDCHVLACAKGTGNYPASCPTIAAGEDGVEASARAYERDALAMATMRAAAAVGADAFSNRWCRVEETLAFARRMGWRRIGIASCAGLMNEARAFAEVLRAQGFWPFGICCKVGSVPRDRFDAHTSCCDFGGISCNPILQAELLAEEETELNVAVGFCVGHDFLFGMHSKAPVTTLVVKDRTLVNNPAAALNAVGTASLYHSMLVPNPEFQAPPE